MPLRVALFIRKAGKVKWFKHMCDMLDDAWVQDVFMAEHGIAGYGFLCGIFEIYGKECGTDPGSWVTIPMATVARKLRVSSAKVERWLNDCATAGKLSFEISLRELRIYIPKMKELRDEWADRKSRELGSDSGVTPEEEERRKKKKEEIPPLPPKGESVGFQKFWDAYPGGVRKVNKSACEEKWKAKKLDAITEQIIQSVEKHKLTDQWMRDGGQYIPAPLVFINQDRWTADLDASNRNVYFHRSGTNIPGNRITPGHERKGGVLQI